MEREVEGDLAILGVLGEHAGHHEVGLVDRDQVLRLLVRHASLRIKNVSQSEARAYFSIMMGCTVRQIIGNRHSCVYSWVRGKVGAGDIPHNSTSRFQRNSGNPWQDGWG